MTNAGRRPPAGKRGGSGSTRRAPGDAPRSPRSTATTGSSKTSRSSKTSKATAGAAATKAAAPPRRSLFGFDRRRRRQRRADLVGAIRHARWPLLVLAVAIVGVLSLGIVPTRTYLERRSEIAEAEAQLARLVSANEADAAHIAALDTDAELERVARRNFRLAMPGEEVYRVLPPSIDPSTVPSGWPFGVLAQRLVVG